MPSRASRLLNPEDLSDASARSLRRLSFTASVELLRHWSREDAPDGTRLDFLETFLREAGVEEGVPHRFALAQAAQFLADPATLAQYVPEEGAADQEWLRFMVVEQKATDSDLAFQIQRARGGDGPPDVDAVRDAREAAGLAPNGEGEDADTLAILRRADDEALGARSFLMDREWLKLRVEGRDMSDGRIAKELGRVGFPCDRSTVRLYRKTHGLSRPGYSG